MSGSSFKIVQVVRRTKVGLGVSSVAMNLTKEFRANGAEVEELSLDTLGLARMCEAPQVISPRLSLLLEVVVFSFVAPVVLRLKYKGYVSISHNDCIIGDIYINHGLQKPLVLPISGDRHLRLLIDPLQLVVFLREELRYRLGRHKVYVNFSKSGEREQAAYFDLGDKRREIIPNGVDLNRFSENKARRATTRIDLGIGDGTMQAIFVGNEFDRKGLAVLTTAMKRCTEEISLIVVGGTPRMIARARAALSPALGERVHFLGAQVEGLPDLYRACDVLVLPSLQEAWPLVLLEAMACGVPCIATPVSSVPEIVLDGQSGILVKRDATQAKDQAQEYSWEAVARRYLGIVEFLARGRPNSTPPAPDV
jgi:glycosyltransferase involved in cell wall biosynthesis